MTSIPERGDLHVITDVHRSRAAELATIAQDVADFEGVGIIGFVLWGTDHNDGTQFAILYIYVNVATFDEEWDFCMHSSLFNACAEVILSDDDDTIIFATGNAEEYEAVMAA